jgi:hypothetical protein
VEYLDHHRIQREHRGCMRSIGISYIMSEAGLGYQQILAYLPVAVAVGNFELPAIQHGVNQHKSSRSKLIVSLPRGNQTFVNIVDIKMNEFCVWVLKV